MNKNHQYGFDLTEDLKQLYGEKYIELNRKRWILLESLENEPFQIKELRDIIQNPIPISREAFEDWVVIKNDVIKNYSMSLRTKQMLRNIEDFVYDYHIMD